MPAAHSSSYRDNGDLAFKQVDFDTVNDYKYKHYVPTWSDKETEDFGKARTVRDVGLKADLSLPPFDTQQVNHLSPSTGTEIHNIQLSSLSENEKNNLAYYLAKRRILVFRNQDFQDLDFSQQKEWASHFGPLIVHPSSGTAKGNPEITILYKHEKEQEFNPLIKARTTSTAWHQDMSYLPNLPSITMLWFMKVPSTGGDTVFCDTVAAYKLLSPTMQSFLENLEAVHSNDAQHNDALSRGFKPRYGPVLTKHPIVIVHPSTGEKALNVNEEFTTHIIGLKYEESQAILQFLFAHIKTVADAQIRARWESGTVVLFDNRVCQHTAVIDFKDSYNRHGGRICVLGEVPSGVNK